MWILLLPLLAQVPSDRAILEAENAREAGAPILRAAIASSDLHAQRLAVRALGRLENPAYSELAVGLLTSPDAQVRRAAVNALAQMRAPFHFTIDRDATVRAVMYESIGRAKPIADDAEAILGGGLRDSDGAVRAGAARGIESLFRLNTPRKPMPRPALPCSQT